MSGDSEYELDVEQQSLLEVFLFEHKEIQLHTAALNYYKAQLKKLANTTDADYLVVDGKRVLQVVRTRPERFDLEAFRQYDPRLYRSFVKQSDAEVVTLRVVEGKK